jgi:WD repeat-containing protein mio
MIWDIHNALPLLSDDRFSMPDPHTSRTPIPRTETGPRTDSRILQQHAPAEMVSALAFLPNSANMLLAGISNRWLRMFDLRKPTPGTTSAAYKVQSIVTDPFDAHRFGCFGDGLITIWDSRKLPHPILTFSDKDALADGALASQAVLYSTIEFSSVRRGILASLERDGKCVRFWDIQECSAQPIETLAREPQRDLITSSTNAPTRLSWATLPWASSAPNHPPQLSPTVVSPLASHVLTNTRHSKIFCSSP